MERSDRRHLLQVLFREFHAELTAQEALLLLPMPRAVTERTERKAQIAAGLARLDRLLARTRALEQDLCGPGDSVPGLCATRCHTREAGYSVCANHNNAGCVVCETA
jgi:hypothetical protein